MFVKFWLKTGTGYIEDEYFWLGPVYEENLYEMLEDWKDRRNNFYRSFEYNYEQDPILPENIFLELQNKYLEQIEQAEEIKQRSIAEAKDMLNKLEQHKKLCLLK